MVDRRLQQLNHLLTIKESATQKAAAALAVSRMQFQETKAKHDQLIVYRQDYMQQIQTLGDSGCNIGRLRNRINFIGQLDSILSQMHQQLAHLAKVRTNCEKEFIKLKADQEAVLQLIERVKLQKERQEMRVEQKESDEYAQKQWYSKNTGIHTIKRSD